MILMEEKISIRWAYKKKGKSIKQIVREFQRARNIVRKAVRDSSPPEYHRSKEIKMPVIDPVKDFIDTILKENRQCPKKQRHTAARIYERLIQEKNFSGCARTVRKYISKIRKNQKEVSIPEVKRNFIACVVI